MTTMREALLAAGLVTVHQMPTEDDLRPQHTPQYVRDAADVEVDDAIRRGRRFYLGYDLRDPFDRVMCAAMLREYDPSLRR